MSVPQEAMAGAPPQAAPMEPGPPPPEGAAPVGAEPGLGGPDEAMAAMEQERIAQMEAIAAAAPQPEQPYTTALVQKLVDAMNGLIENVDPDMAGIEFVSEGPRIDGPLPPEVFVPFVLIMSFVGTMEGMEKYMMDPATLVNDAAIRKATAQLGMIAKDKDVIAQMQEVPEEGVPEEEVPEGELPEEELVETEGAMPEEMAPEDEALMARM